MKEIEILVNSAQCLLCNDVLVSHYIHEFVTCTCGALSVDGGNSYLKRNYTEEAYYVELSLDENDDFEDIRKVYSRGARGIDGKSPLTWIPLCEMSDEHVKNCITYNNQRGQKLSTVNKFYRKELKFRKKNKITIKDN